MSLPETSRDHERLKTLNEEYAQTDASLAALYEEWERISAETTKA
jgi:cell shape-determining protein MreC